jgi:hypothetical protein
MAWFGPSADDCNCCVPCNYCDCSAPSSETGIFGKVVQFKVEVFLPEWIYYLSDVDIEFEGCECPAYSRRINVGPRSGTYVWNFNFRCVSGAYTLTDLTGGPFCISTLMQSFFPNCKGTEVIESNGQFCYSAIAIDGKVAFRFRISLGTFEAGQFELTAILQPCAEGNPTTAPFELSYPFPNGEYWGDDCPGYAGADFGYITGEWVCA